MMKMDFISYQLKLKYKIITISFIKNKYKQNLINSNLVFKYKEKDGYKLKLKR